MKDQGSEKLQDVASAWAVRRAAGLNPEEEAALEEWLGHPFHEAALAEAELALSFLSRPVDDDEARELEAALGAMESARANRLQRQRRFAFGGVGLAAAATIALIFAALAERPANESRSTAVAVRPLVETLPDGTRVELNAKAAVDLDFSPQLRGVRLLRGEAHFDIARDPTRPFVVTVGPVKVQALGTAFNVRIDAGRVDIMVTEGKVRVSEETSASAAPGPVPINSDLAAGHRAMIPLHGQPSSTPLFATVSPAEIRRELSWREMRYELTDATLDEAVTLFNGKGGARLLIGESQIRSRRISGIYWADDPDTFTKMVAEALDLKVEQADGKLVLRSK